MFYKKITKFGWLIIILAFIFLISAQSSQAAFQDDNQNFLEKAGLSASYRTAEQGQEGYINPIIANSINTIIGFIGVIFLLLVIYSGIQWMASGGNEETIAKARKRVINGTIGVGLTLAAFIVTNLVYNFFDERFLKEPGAGPQSPPYFEEVDCVTDAQCSDRIGPISGNPYLCDEGRGFCVECLFDADCNDSNYECNTTYGLCVPRDGLSCNSIAVRDYCISNADCRWETAHGNRTAWEDQEGTCVSIDEYLCDSQCSNNTPYCLEDENTCVRCTQQSDCGLIGWCTPDNECFFD